MAWRATRVWLVGVAFTAALAAVLIWQAAPGDRVTFEVGDVATRDVRTVQHFSATTFTAP